MMKRFKRYFASIILLSISIASAAEKSLMIVGYDGIGWYPYTTSISQQGDINHAWKKIQAVRDPGHVTLQPETGDFFIKANDGQLYHYQLARNLYAPLFPTKTATASNSYTQLRAHIGGLAMVRLMQGKSRETQIVVVNTSEQKPKISNQVKQMSAQFHPLIHGQHLFYAHVSCRLACDPLIQEVWQQNLKTGQARQLTRLNATSYLHSVDEAARFGYISSNRRGYYHLAQLDLGSHAVTWLTEGQVTDSFPSIADDDLYFIRRTTKGAHLMLLTLSPMSNPLKTLPLPEGVQKIRYLEVTH